jgi:hypothetical protein
VPIGKHARRRPVTRGETGDQRIIIGRADIIEGHHHAPFRSHRSACTTRA